MTNYSETILTPDQSDQHPASWLELDMPWSAMDMSNNQSFDLAQRPRTLIWSEGIIDGPAPGFQMQRLNSSSLYPSHISSPLSNPSCSSSEIAPLNSGFRWPEQWHDIVPNYAFLGEPAIFSEDQNLADLQVQCQPEIGNSQFLPSTVNGQYHISNESGSPVPMSNPVRFMSGDFTPADWPTQLNKELLIDVRRPVDNFQFNPQHTFQELDNQFRPNSDVVAPTTSNACKWEPVVSVGSIHQLNSKAPSRSNKRKKGCRVGPLAADVAERAGKVRKVGACWRCWYYHITVSLSKSPT